MAPPGATYLLLKGQEMTTAMPAPRLPDPVHDVDFYRDVPVKRLIAWVIDALLIPGWIRDYNLGIARRLSVAPA